MSDEILHTRTMPPEWPELVARSESILAVDEVLTDDFPLSTEQATALYDLSGELDNLTLETNRYFGLGQAMCRLANLFKDPTERNKAIHNAASRMSEIFRHHGSSKEPKIRICDIGGLDFFGSFNQISRSAVRSLPVAEAALTDALMERSVARRLGTEERIRDFKIENLTRRDTTIESLNRNADASANVILKRALMTLAGESGRLDAYVEDIVSDDELRMLRLDRVSVGLACLRLDEFHAWQGGQGDVRNIVTGGRDGVLRFDKTYLGNNKPPEVRPRKDGKLPVLREERLTCPALQAGLIPIMLEVVPETIILTGEIMHQRHIRKVGWRPRN